MALPSPSAPSSPPSPPPYLSQAWADQAIARVRGDEHIKAALASHNVSVLTVVDDAPADRVRFLYASFDGEGHSDLRVGMDPDALLRDVPAPTFTIRGTYATFAAIRDGTMTEKHAFVHRLLHISGHKFKALMLAHPMQALTHALAQVPAKT